MTTRPDSDEKKPYDGASMYDDPSPPTSPPAGPIPKPGYGRVVKLGGKLIAVRGTTPTGEAD